VGQFSVSGNTLKERATNARTPFSLALHHSRKQPLSLLFAKGRHLIVDRIGGSLAESDERKNRRGGANMCLLIDPAC